MEDHPGPDEERERDLQLLKDWEACLRAYKRAVRRGALIELQKVMGELRLFEQRGLDALARLYT